MNSKENLLLTNGHASLNSQRWTSAINQLLTRVSVGKNPWFLLKTAQKAGVFTLSIQLISSNFAHNLFIL
jgi:hypothetical protein